MNFENIQAELTSVDKATISRNKWGSYVLNTYSIDEYGFLVVNAGYVFPTRTQAQAKPVKVVAAAKVAEARKVVEEMEPDHLYFCRVEGDRIYFHTEDGKHYWVTEDGKGHDEVLEAIAEDEAAALDF